MTIDAAYVYAGLLRHNYFPMVTEHRDELPPVFSTHPFDPTIADALLATGPAIRSFDQIAYRTTRYTNVTRMMHIPHPLPYARLCRCIHDNWASLQHICASQYSRIIPQRRCDTNDERVIVYDYQNDQVDEVDSDRLFVIGREDFEADVSKHFGLSCGSRFLVVADIASCFNTIYTHAIAWALVGHETAKATPKKDGLWYNKLDCHQRNLKRQETQGIPIGPGTSNIICEVILQTTDNALAQKGYRFTRYIDDYHCYCEDHNQAEQFIHDLEQELARFLLTLNINKVAIIRLPTPYKDAWVIDLQLHLPKGPSLSSREVVTYLDYALALQRNHQDGSVVKYALRSLMSKITEENVTEFLSYALNLSCHYPVVLPVICSVVNVNRTSIVNASIADLVLVNLHQHLKYKRSDAVCWCLYCAGLLDMPMDKATATQIINSCDCMSISMLLSLDVHVDLVVAFVNSLADKDPYDKDQYWILIHELGPQLKNPKLQDYYRATGLKFLADNNVSFISVIDPQDEF